MVTNRAVSLARTQLAECGEVCESSGPVSHPTTFSTSIKKAGQISEGKYQHSMMLRLTYLHGSKKKGFCLSIFCLHFLLTVIKMLEDEGILC